MAKNRNEKGKSGKSESGKFHEKQERVKPWPKPPPNPTKDKKK